MKIFLISVLLIFILITLNSQKIIVSAIGDIMAHDNLQYYAEANPAGYDVLFEKTKNIFLNDDLTFANLETPISETIGIKGYPCFNAKPAFLKAVKNAGIDVLSLANNHSYDQSDTGILSTLKNVNELNFINSGIGLTPADTKKPVIFYKNDISIGFISVTFAVNSDKLIEKSDKPYTFLVPLQNEKKVNELCTIVNDCKQIVDVMIVSYHCGDEYVSVPSKLQESIMKKLSDSGADIILAHHPHVLQKVETYKTKDGRNTLIAYSLGNFISAQARYINNQKVESKINDTVLTKTAESIILQFEIEKNNNTISINNICMIPIFNVSFKIAYNKKIYDGFQTTPVEEIINMDNTSDTRFAPYIKDLKKLVEYRNSKILDLIKLPVINLRNKVN